MSSHTLPPAESVDGDLMTAAQGLLLLGWTAPAVLTARVALEQSMVSAIVSAGIQQDRKPKVSPGRLCRLLKKHGLINEDFKEDTMGLNRQLSSVAHGADVCLFDAVQLVEQTRERLEDFQSLRYVIIR